MNFIATRYEDDGGYSETFAAESWAEAETICQQNGWLLDGELIHTGAVDVNHPAPSMGVH